MALIGLAAALALGGCSGLDIVEDLAGDVVLPSQQEVALGERLSQQIEAWKPAGSAAQQRRVAAIGQRLLRQAGEVSHEFRFKVIDDAETVNAFALPGGHVYVTTGMMRVADTDAQLASVLGHEIAHVTQRHIAERMAAEYGVQLVASAALAQNPGALAALTSSVMQQGFLLKYSRDQELEADRVGVRYLARAGYDPQAAIEVFTDLARVRDGERPPVFLSSHPTTKQRIEQLEQIAAQAR